MDYIFRNGTPVNRTMGMVRFTDAFKAFAKRHMSEKEYQIVRAFLRTGYLARHDGNGVVSVITRGQVEHYHLAVPPKFLIKDDDDEHNQKAFDGLAAYPYDACGKGVCVREFNHVGRCMV